MTKPLPKWSRIKELFERATELPLAERDAFIREVTGGQPSLRRELEELLAADEGAGTFLDTPAGPRLLASGSGGRVSSLRPLEEGERLGDFNIVRKLGSGSFADVYLARQLSLGRVVALKISPDQGNEAQTMAVLEHPNIVQVFSETIDRRRKIRIICMQYVPGISLHRLLAEAAKSGNARPSGRDMLALVDRFSSPDTRFDPEQIADRQRLERADFVDAVLGLAGRLAAALDYAHDRGVLHLDVKPENVLITPYGRPMLMDFNVSLSRHDGTAANPELFGGTFDFMAPEHLEAFHQRERGEAMKRLDPRADVFSLGALMRSALGKVTQPENDEVAGLATLLDRSTAPDRDRRFVSAAALGKAVGSYVELRGVRRSIVERGLISSFSTHFPVDFLAFFGAFLALQLLIVGVAFENLFLVNLLEGPAREAFHRFNVVEMPLTVLFGYLLWLGYVGRFRGPLRRAESYIDDAPQRAAYRRRMLRLPIAALFAWLPSLILAATFPWRQTVAVDPYGLRVFAGYLLPFTSIWVLTLACLALYAEFTCVRLMYPKFFFGEVEIRATAARELRSMPAVLFGFCAITIVLPLVSGALTLVFYSSSNMDIIGFRTSFYHLTFCFLGPLIGFLVAASSVRRYIQAYFALTGNGGLSLGRMI